jgi:hypothetical protein
MWRIKNKKVQEIDQWLKFNMFCRDTQGSTHSAMLRQLEGKLHLEAGTRTLSDTKSEIGGHELTFVPVIDMQSIVSEDLTPVVRHCPSTAMVFAEKDMPCSCPDP